MKFKNWALFLFKVLGLEDKCPTLPLSKEAYRNTPYTKTLIQFPLTSGLKLMTYHTNSQRECRKEKLHWGNEIEDFMKKVVIEVNFEMQLILAGRCS